ncbi:DUF1918 domain-containing protein [Streptomyces sp. NPDC058195]|uniref:DUF1918 domain-containing protein n=1 Tax=Streptomyces sp. NPDC058195 TaxID=3346375 RepID=UPI0036E9B8D3
MAGTEARDGSVQPRARLWARTGDRLIVGGATAGDKGRDGEIVGLHHTDGSPPYDVRWSDTGRTTLVFPGPDARVHHGPAGDSAAGLTRGGAARRPPASRRTLRRRTAAPVGGRRGGSMMNAFDDGHHQSDLGRRVATRRRQLGLSREEVADRAGATAGYLTYVEERLPVPGIGFLVRLADALETTVQELMGFTADLPPGEGPAGARPRLEEVGEKECWELLGDHGVGRVAVEAADVLDVFPVNYRVIGGSVLFMTTATSALALAAASGAEIAFEEDHLDEAFHQGWSVLLVGPVRLVPDSVESRPLRDAAHAQSWAGEGRDTLVLLAPHRVTGRRILVPGAPGTADGPDEREL